MRKRRRYLLPFALLNPMMNSNLLQTFLWIQYQPPPIAFADETSSSTTPLPSDPNTQGGGGYVWITLRSTSFRSIRYRAKVPDGVGSSSKFVDDIANGQMIRANLFLPPDERLGGDVLLCGDDDDGGEEGGDIRRLDTPLSSGLRHGGVDDEEETERMDGTRDGRSLRQRRVVAGRKAEESVTGQSSSTRFPDPADTNTATATTSSSLAILVSSSGCSLRTKARTASKMNEFYRSSILANRTNNNETETIVVPSIRYLLVFNDNPHDTGLDFSDDCDDGRTSSPPDNDCDKDINTDDDDIGIAILNHDDGGNLLARMLAYGHVYRRNPYLSVESYQPTTTEDGGLGMGYNFPINLERFQPNNEQSNPKRGNDDDIWGGGQRNRNDNNNNNSRRSSGNNDKFYWVRFVLFGLLLITPCLRALFLWYSAGGRIRFRRDPETGRTLYWRGLEYVRPTPRWYAFRGTNGGTRNDDDDDAERAGRKVMTEEEVLSLPEIVYGFGGLGYDKEEEASSSTQRRKEKKTDVMNEKEKSHAPSAVVAGFSADVDDRTSIHEHKTGSVGESQSIVPPPQPAEDKEGQAPSSHNNKRLDDAETTTACDSPFPSHPLNVTTEDTILPTPNGDDDVEKDDTTTSIPPRDVGDPDVCSICIEEFIEGEKLRLLPRCKHAFHTDCILPWLTERQGRCPLCKTPVLLLEGDEEDEAEGRREESETGSSEIPELRDDVGDTETGNGVSGR